AMIRDTDVEAAGDVTVTATQASHLDATARNEAIADAALDGVLTKGSATKGLAGGGLLASNKMSTSATATIDFTGLPGTILAVGDGTVAASDAAELAAHSTVVQSAIVENTA